MKSRAAADATFRSRDTFDLDVPTSYGAETFDIRQETGWDKDFFDDTEALEQHAGKEAWWTARLADEIAILGDFTENIYEPYMAHLRRFAVYAIAGQGTSRSSSTKRDIDDMIFMLFSRARTEQQRERFVHFAFMGYMQEQFGSKVAVERLYSEQPGIYRQHHASFYAEMFSYQPMRAVGDAFERSAESVWVEDANRMRISAERSKALIEAVAGAFRNRGFLLRQAAENEKVRRNAMGGVLEDVARKVAQIIREGKGSI